jgi:hypothetical protein
MACAIPFLELDMMLFIFIFVQQLAQPRWRVVGDSACSRGFLAANDAGWAVFPPG